MNKKFLTVDVREDIRHGREPFSKIMSAVASLRDEQDLLLIAPFEPAPLFSVLAKKGFQHSARQIAAAHWEVRFTRGNFSQTTGSPPEEAHPRPVTPLFQSGQSLPTPAVDVIDVDARGLEPPQPMVKILEALAALPDGAEVRARTDRRPIHLYAHLEERGFTGQSEEQNDGSFITHIRRR
jgi:uncharacterized protein (DUF2249 family)